MKRQINKWNKIASPETIAVVNANLINSRVGIADQWEKRAYAYSINIIVTVGHLFE